MATFGIGEAARRAGISPDLIRYYERVGILPEAPRTDSGYRQYSEDTIGRLVFVRNAIRFGFGSKQLAGFLKARAKGQPPCKSVRAAGEKLLGEMDQRLRELQKARVALAAILVEWDTRLATTPDGTPAKLLSMIPDLARQDRRPPKPRTRTAGR